MARRILFVFTVLLLCSLCLSCTYFWRKEYKLTDGRGYVVANEWKIAPRFISPAVCSDLKGPVRTPDMFAIAFRAARPRPVSGQQGAPETITDIVIDSALFMFRRKGTRFDLHLNEAAWVSYPAISPDTLVKTFRAVDQLGDLIWMTLPSDSDTVDITLYTTTHSSELSTLKRIDDGRAPLDTAYWRPSDKPPVHPPPMTMQMDCRDIMWILPGFRNCD